MKTTFIRILLIGILSYIFALLVNPPGQFAPIDNLRLEKITLPGEWLCTWCDEEETVVPDWEFAEAEDWVYEDYDRYASSANPNDTMFVGIWQDSNSGGWIETVIADYKLPIRADLAYYLHDPPKIYWKSNWNFVYEKENIVPSDWDFINLAADEEAILCGGGDETRCGGWYYHARYKQYYLFIWYPLELDSGTFERIVEAVTEHFAEEIIR